MALVDSLLTEIYLLSPNTGDVLVVRSKDASNPELLLGLVSVKERLMAEGIKPVFIVMEDAGRIEDVPKEAFTEQGYLWRDEVRAWLAGSVPLGRQASLLRLFDTRFGFAES